MAPLDWGLGHATRCIPIINALTAAGYEIVIAAEGAQANLLQTEFPSLQLLPLEGYRVQYSKHKWSLAWKLLIQLPRLRSVIHREQKWLDSVIEEHKIDLVISDNRYGLSSKKIPCIFITHQLTIKAPFAWMEKIMQRINYQYINRYSSCWVPDVAGANNAAGILSHPLTMPKTQVHYIGLLSRFKKKDAVPVYDYCILLSGPEPQRTLLEKRILESISSVEGKILLVRGKPGSKEILKTVPHIQVKNHLPGNELENCLLQSEYIVCRSGYTTVMELLSLQKKSILIPTPGQTEQEYLASKLAADNICVTEDQFSFDATKLFLKASGFHYRIPDFDVFNEINIVGLLTASLLQHNLAADSQIGSGSHK